MSTYNVEIEKHILALLLQYPQAWAEINVIDEKDFSKVNRPVFALLKQQIEISPQNPAIASVILAEKFKIYSIALDGGIDPYDYLEALRLKSIKQSDAVNLAQELKAVTVKRELIEKCNETIKSLKDSSTSSFDDLIGLVDKNLSSVNTSYFKNETVELFSDLIEVIEERGENPIKAEDMGYMGPFQSINEIMGSIVFPGSFTVIGSRTGGGKSSLGFYYNVFLAEKYGLPILHLDAAEMTVKQLQNRAVCALSMGRVPLWAVRSGEWRKDANWTRIIRDEVWPRVKKIKIDFVNIGNMNAKELVSFIRRHYYNKVGRGNHMLINWDYIKGTEAVSKFAAEYQMIGHMVNDLKVLVTDEIIASVWTGVQNNKTGIYTGKSAAEIRDSEESFSLSDRIIQQSTNSFTMRYKIPEELAIEKNLFGNVRLQSVKERELLGKQYEKALLPVKMPDGRMVKNFFNLSTVNFSYEDKGDLHRMIEALGHTDILKDTEKKDSTGPI